MADEREKAVDIIFTKPLIHWCETCGRSGYIYGTASEIRCELCDGRGYSWNWEMLNAYKKAGMTSAEYASEAEKYFREQRSTSGSTDSAMTREEALEVVLGGKKYAICFKCVTNPRYTLCETCKATGIVLDPVYIEALEVLEVTQDEGDRPRKDQSG